MKFGGTSVADADAFANVSSIVKVAEKQRPVVVVSAIAGCTNALLASVERAREGELRGATRSLEEHFDRHTAISNKLVESEARVDIDSRDCRRTPRDPAAAEDHRCLSGHQSAPSGSNRRIWRVAVCSITGGGAARERLAGAIRRRARMRKNRREFWRGRAFARHNDQNARKSDPVD